MRGGVAARFAALAALAVLATLAGAACGSRSAPAPDRPATTTEPDDRCHAADDCELVDACCGCNAGGKRIAIRKDAVAAFEASREQRCADVVCAQVISTDPSCDAEAICGSRNRCRVAPHVQHP
ncbi:MAG TPA: hypothetical protein VFT22_28815 [Kofleriaceae bacterium]|nr:hypothetical protein [Kofleriaceae bacterium]